MSPVQFVVALAPNIPCYIPVFVTMKLMGTDSYQISQFFNDMKRCVSRNKGGKNIVGVMDGFP